MPGPTETAPEARRTFAVHGQSDVAVARQQAQRFARGLGFGPRRVAEIAIVVSELASNIVKYGVRGDITLSPGEPGEAASSGRRSMTVVARDVGPPIHDLELAFQDGFDDRGPIDPAILARRGGLGTGLGAIARLADRFEVQQGEEGKEITVVFAGGGP